MSQTHFYEVSAFARTPQSSGAPTITFLQRILTLGGASEGAEGGLSWSRELCSDGFIIVSTMPETIGTALGNRLLDLRSNPVELWLWRDGVLCARGPLVAWQIQGNSIVLNARGLLYYLRYMMINADVSLNMDQSEVVATLIDTYQGQAYGNFGLDTTSAWSNPHGVNIEKEYRRVELINLYDEIHALGETDTGFDVDVDVETGDILLYHPERGTDKSGSVFLDMRGVTTPNIAYSLAAKQFATAAIGSGSGEDGSGNQQSYFAESVEATLRQEFGLAYVGTHITGKTTQSEVNSYTTQARKLANNPYFVPSKEYFPVVGATIDDFEPGDTVTTVYDTGFGEFSIAMPIKNQNISVSPDGEEKISVEYV